MFSLPNKTEEEVEADINQEDIDLDNMEEFASKLKNFDKIKVQGARTRSDLIRNLSLTLLSATSPHEVLEIFTKEML